MNLKPIRTTIKKVATVTGLSTMPVSYLVNSRPNVSAQTHKRIKKIIEELEYQPSVLARSPVQQRSYTLGAVAVDPKYLGPSLTLKEITNLTIGTRYALLIKELFPYHTGNISPIF